MRAILVCGLILVLMGCGMARSGALNQAQELYTEADYRGAIQRVDEALTYGTPSAEERARANLLKARCHEELGELHEAAALYAFVTKEFPNTAESYQAAAALARLTRVTPTRRPEERSF